MCLKMLPGAFLSAMFVHPGALVKPVGLIIPFPEVSGSDPTGTIIAKKTSPVREGPSHSTLFTAGRPYPLRCGQGFHLATSRRKGDQPPEIFLRKCGKRSDNIKQTGAEFKN